jgi:hypothetical protein
MGTSEIGLFPAPIDFVQKNQVSSPYRYCYGYGYERSNQEDNGEPTHDPKSVRSIHWYLRRIIEWSVQ